MANWYGIDGIEYHHKGPWADFQITYNGVTDSAGVDVESAMYMRFTTDEDTGQLIARGSQDETELFVQYMRDNEEEVKYLIELARGLVDDSPPIG